MARKSRKPQKFIMHYKPSPITVGYIRISNANKEQSSSIENQKLIIENWGRVHQTPILDYYIDNGSSGRSFDRPAFQKMLEDIVKEKIECVVVKDLSRLGRDTILKWFSQLTVCALYLLTISLIRLIEFMLSAIKTALLEASGVKEKPLGKNAQNAALRRQFVLDYLKDNALIRNADLCEGLGVSPATANRILRELSEDGTLERVRDGKVWAYELKEKV